MHLDFNNCNLGEEKGLMSPGGLLGRGGAQAGPWRVSRIFTGAEGSP